MALLSADLELPQKDIVSVCRFRSHVKKRHRSKSPGLARETNALCQITGSTDCREEPAAPGIHEEGQTDRRSLVIKQHAADRPSMAGVHEITPAHTYAY